MRRPQIEVPQDALAELCRRHHIRELSLFGSVLRDDFTEGSDVDVLVEFEPGRLPGFIGFARIERELSELLDRTVDLHTRQSLSPYFRDHVLEEATAQYLAA